MNERPDIRWLDGLDTAIEPYIEKLEARVKELEAERDEARAEAEAHWKQTQEVQARAVAAEEQAERLAEAAEKLLDEHGYLVRAEFEEANELLEALASYREAAV
jgi:Tfp pilus assembly protein FimV